jgi:hypothetical protein
VIVAASRPPLLRIAHALSVSLSELGEAGERKPLTRQQQIGLSGVPEGAVRPATRRRRPSAAIAPAGLAARPGP